MDVRGGLDLDHQYLMTVETTMHINIVSIIVFFCKCNMIEMQLCGDYFYGVNENWSIQYGLKIRSCSSGCPHLFEILETILIDLVALKRKSKVNCFRNFDVQI